MALPPTPAKQSMTIVLSSGAASDTCCAILLYADSVIVPTDNSVTVFLPRHRLGGDAKPCVFCHPDAVIILREEAVALVPIPIMFKSN